MVNGEIVKESGKSEGSTRTTKTVQATAQEALYFMPDKARIPQISDDFSGICHAEGECGGLHHAPGTLLATSFHPS